MSKSTSVLDSIILFPKQLTEALKVKVDLPKNYKSINKIIVSGMGGSNLGARMIKNIFANNLKLPLFINTTYEIPAYIDRNTLFIASSYSGNTEEIINAYKEAKKKRAKIIVITSNQDSQLGKLAKRDKLPLIVFPITFNPSNQPRFGVGYSFITILKIIQKIGGLKSKEKELKTIIKHLESWEEKLMPNKSNNQASKIANNLFTHNIVLITGEFLEGNAHTLRNQINENSKNFASYLTLPELNHYALEGLSKPEDKNLICLYFESTLYSPVVQKRMNLTVKVLKKNKIKANKIKLKGQSKLEQSLEMLQLGLWITYYLSELNKVDPIKIPWVDWFKKELK